MRVRRERGERDAVREVNKVTSRLSWTWVIVMCVCLCMGGESAESAEGCSEREVKQITSRL